MTNTKLQYFAGDCDVQGASQLVTTASGVALKTGWMIRETSSTAVLKSGNEDSAMINIVLFLSNLHNFTPLVISLLVMGWSLQH